MQLGFCEDYRRIVINIRHKLILIRSRNDNNCLIGDPMRNPEIVQSTVADAACVFAHFVQQHMCYVQTPKVLFIRIGRKEKEEVWKDVNSNCLAGIHTEARAASRTHFYGSTSRNDAITPVSKSSAIVGPNSSQGT